MILWMIFYIRLVIINNLGVFKYMFSSNQILKISGSLTNNDLLYALEFALNTSGNLECFTRCSNPSKCVFQITEDGRYCLGWGYKEIPKGWKEYPFDFDVKIISQIIVNYLNKSEIEEGIYDGSYEKGFLMQNIVETMGDEWNGIKKPFYGIVEFSPFTCFYSK